MVEDELVEILTEYKTIAESEHNSFVSTLVNNPNFAQVVFNSLQGFEVLTYRTNSRKGTDNSPQTHHFLILVLSQPDIVNF